MHFHETTVSGAYVVEMKPSRDQRGFFARSWCAKEFAKHGLVDRFVQSNISFTERRGTLRGLHYQPPPRGETKCIRCVRGAVFDVIVDLRGSSPTYLKHFAVTLDDEKRLTLYVPEGVAHGYQTLTDASEVFYQMSDFFDPVRPDAGVRWNDSAFGINWPIPDPLMSDRDRTYPDFLHDR